MSLQRKFIRENPGEAEIQRALYSNFKVWVSKKFPSGISDEKWQEILYEDESQVT